MVLEGIRNRLLTASVIALCAIQICAVPAAATEDHVAGTTQQDTGEPWAFWRPETGVTNSIVAADRLRSLSRELAALACHITQDVAPEDSRLRLGRSAKEFTGALRALEFGGHANPDQKEVPQAETLTEIHAIKQLWSPMQEAIEVVTKTPDDAAALSLVSAGSEVLHDMSTNLFAQVKAQHTRSTEMTTRDSVLIDIAGQQAALTQHISGIACQIWAGDRSAKRMEEFSSSAWMLERGLVSLQHGLPSMGIIPAPTQEIRNELTLALGEWRSLKVFVIGMTESAVPAVAQRLLYERLNEEQTRLNGIVQLYAEYSTHLY